MRHELLTYGFYRLDDPCIRRRQHAERRECEQADVNNVVKFIAVRRTVPGAGISPLPGMVQMRDNALCHLISHRGIHLH